MIEHNYKRSISIEPPERGYTVTHRIDISGKTFFFLFLMVLFVKYVLLEVGALFLK